MATEDYGKESYDKVTAAIKKEAEQQRIKISLTPEQLEEVLGQIGGIDPSRPAVMDLIVEDKPVGDLRMAGYWYAGDTCCV